MNPFDLHQAYTRRQMIGLGARGLGALGAASLLNPSLLNAAINQAEGGFSGTLGGPHFKPTAKRVIYLFLSGGPSHIDLYDYHPEMRKFHGTELPNKYSEWPENHRHDFKTGLLSLCCSHV